MPEPEEGWDLEEVRAVLDQAVMLRRVVPPGAFIPPPEEDIIDSWL